MRIAVCDDCYEDAYYLQTILKEHTVRIYVDTKDLLQDIEKGGVYYDLYLLDIYIDAFMNGIELAAKIRETDEDVAICFISTSEEFYREAYDLYAVQYLVKPVQKEMLDQLIEKIEKNIARQKEQRLSFKYRGKSGSIPYSKILYISSREHSLFIFCTDGTVQECVGKLNEIESQLKGDVFRRCHQSFLVNMYHVDNLSGKDLVVSGYRIPVSRRYYAEIKDRYHEILFEEVD